MVIIASHVMWRDYVLCKSEKIGKFIPAVMRLLRLIGLISGAPTRPAYISISPPRPRADTLDCETLGLLGKVKLETLGLVVGGDVRGAWRSA